MPRTVAQLDSQPVEDLGTLKRVLCVPLVPGIGLGEEMIEFNYGRGVAPDVYWFGHRWL